MRKKKSLKSNREVLIFRNYENPSEQQTHLSTHCALWVFFFPFSLQLMRGRTQNAFRATALYKEYNQFSIIAFGRLAGCQDTAK